MHRILFAPAAVLLLGLTPLTGMAASIGERPVVAANPSITFVDGWWEQEHHDKDAPQKYWGLQPQQRARYDSLQAEQARREQQRRKIDEANARAQKEQHQLLGFQVNIR